MGPWLPILQGSFERVVIQRYPFLAYCDKMSYTNLTECHCNSLRTDFFEFYAGHGYDRSMPYMFGICVFGNSGKCQILHVHQDFQLMWMDLFLELELSMGNLVPIRRNSVLLGLCFSLDSVIQADMELHMRV